jgi:hypothetical protein
MRLKRRQFLSYVLLATYAGISIVGDGLHELMPEAGHHHHGLYVVNCASLDDTAVTSTGAVVTASDSDADSHVCEICKFLFQAVSQPAQVAVPIDWQPLVVAAPSRPQPIYRPTSLGVQAPRGPPQLA